QPWPRDRRWSGSRRRRRPRATAEHWILVGASTAYLPRSHDALLPVIPAKAGIQGCKSSLVAPGPRLSPGGRKKARPDDPDEAEEEEALSARGLNPLRRGEDLVHMARHLDLAPDVADDAFFVDQEGGALDAHVFAAIHALLHPGAIGLADLALLVGG